MSQYLLTTLLKERYVSRADKTNCIKTKLRTNEHPFNLLSLLSPGSAFLLLLFVCPVVNPRSNF